MKSVAIVLYPGLTPLDVAGPYHVISQFPGYEITFVSEKKGPISDGKKFELSAESALSDVTFVDMLVVPGGLPAIKMARSGGPYIEWIRAIHPLTEWTLSICTGALMLGAAGVLQGMKATTHWYSHHELSHYGAQPIDARFVRDGKIMTSAGVSAGIDMSLALASEIFGETFAQSMQLDMEYDPAPPFNAGHPRSAPEEVTAALRDIFDSVVKKL